MAAMAFLITIVLGYPYLSYLRRAGLGKKVRIEGPEQHIEKTGTPTMGGLLVTAVVLALTVVPDAAAVSRVGPIDPAADGGHGADDAARLVRRPPDAGRAQGRGHAGAHQIRAARPDRARRVVRAVGSTERARHRLRLSARRQGADRDRLAGDPAVAAGDHGHRARGQPDRRPRLAGRPHRGGRLRRLRHHRRAVRPDLPGDVLLHRRGRAAGVPVVQRRTRPRCSWATRARWRSARRWRSWR